MGTTVKTAVSLDRELFERAQAAAGELGTSRSGLIARALEEFLVRQSNRRLLEQINAACGPGPESGEKEMLEGMLAEGSRVVDEEW